VCAADLYCTRAAIFLDILVSAALANWLPIASAITSLIIVARRRSGAHTAIFGAGFRGKKSKNGNFLGRLLQSFH
jgi:hypothetical protein